MTQQLLLLNTATGLFSCVFRCSLWNSRNRRTALFAATSLHIVPATCCSRNTKLKVERQAHLTTGRRFSVRAERFDPNTCWFQLTTADYTCGHGTESAWMLSCGIGHISTSVPGLFETKPSVVHTSHTMILQLSTRSACLATIAEAIVCIEFKLTAVSTTFSTFASTKRGLGCGFNTGETFCLPWVLPKHCTVTVDSEG